MAGRLRGPVPVGSIADRVFITEKATSVDEVNEAFQEKPDSDRYKGVLGLTNDSWVSTDIVMDPHASVVDLEMTQVADGDLVKVMIWYDNESGYASQMVKQGKRFVGS